MPEPMFRKLVATVEEIHIDGGRPVATPLRIAVAAAVFTNPYANVWADDLEPLIAEFAPTVGPLLADRAAALLGEYPRLPRHVHRPLLLHLQQRRGTGSQESHL